MKVNSKFIRNLFVLALVSGSSFLWANFSYAMTVTPLQHEMTSAGKFNRSVFRVVNTSKKPLPIELKVLRVFLDQNGKITRTPADDDFYVFPPQRMIASGAAQNFRIQWAGNPSITQSQSYIIEVNQVPVGVSEDVRLGIETVMSYAIPVNVRPMAGQPKLSLLKTESARDHKGKLRPALTLKNSGNVHARLSDTLIILSADGWSKKLTPDYLRPNLGVGLIQPGKSRRIVLPVELPQNIRNLKATVTLLNVRTK